MILSMKKTLDFGFKLSLTESTRTALSESLQMTNQDLAAFLTPKESDYIMVPVRALSATLVQGNTIDFGHNDGQALKESVGMFDGLTVLKDHVFSVDNWVGHTQSSYWDTLTPDVPPGVNSLMKIDSKADPKLARGLLSDMLNSVSVTVAFDYEKSHPSMSDFDFMMNLGSVVDGTGVRALVTKVTRLYEISVVWQGADKYAKQIGADGRIEVPGTSNSLQENIMDWKKLALALGLTSLANPDEATVTAAVIAINGELATNKATVLALTAEKENLNQRLTDQTKLVVDKTTEVTTLTQKNTELTANAKLGDDYLKAQRTEALRLYNLVEGDKATEPMRNMINGSSLEIANSFITSYKARAEAIAPLACAKCGSTDLNRKASTQSDVDGVVTTTSSKLEDKRIARDLERMHGKKAE